MKDMRGVEEDIRSLYEQYANDIYRYAWLTLGDSSVAKDVVQEVFLRAFRSWEQFRSEANPRTWLMSITRNYLFDLLRKKRTERRVVSDYREIETVTDSSPSIDTRIMLEDALSRLKETYRAVFVLRHVQHHSIDETAQIMGWTPGNVKTTDRRAIAQLRTILGFDSEEVNQS